MPSELQTKGIPPKRLNFGGEASIRSMCPVHIRQGRSDRLMRHVMFLSFMVMMSVHLLLVKIVSSSQEANFTIGACIDVYYDGRGAL